MELLKEILIIFSISIGVLFVCNRLRIPSIVGFLITGICIGPHAYSLISSVPDVEILAEIGVILLLFTIGMEFSMKSLLQIKRSVILGGSIQVFLTIAVVYAIFVFLGKDSMNALFFGFLVSLSSTAIVLKILQERSEMESPGGRITLAMLIFQDIIIVPLMLITPILAGASDNAGHALLIFGLKSIGIILVVIVCMKWIAPWLFYQIARTRSRELFILSVVMVCFSIAFLTYSIGLSLALGAFLAGLIVSETEYSHEAISNIIPFKEIFTSIFFVSIGMLLNVQIVIKMPAYVGIMSAGIFFIKFVIAAIAVIILGYPLKTSIVTGLAICQVGEFSFILSKTGIDLKILSNSDYQVFLGASILTMIAAPFLINSSEFIVGYIDRLPLPGGLKNGLYRFSASAAEESQNMNDHCIIVGFGVNGQNVSSSAKIAGIPYVIVELNPSTVKKEQNAGESIYYGDASNDEVLNHVQISGARVVVIAIPDAAATRRIVVTARKLNPLVYIIARTRYVTEVSDLFELGADEVIPEEFETSIEIFTHVLKKYNIPNNDIFNFINTIRCDGYEMFRNKNKPVACAIDEFSLMKNMEFVTYRVEEKSPGSNKTIAELDFRKEWNVSILAITRENNITYNPHGEETILAEDILLLMGTPDSIAGAVKIFRS